MNLTTIILVVLPFVSGIVVVLLARLERGTFLEVKGVVGPYFGAVAVIFAIYAGLMTNEIWTKIAAVNTTISQEGDSLRGMLRLSEALGEKGAPIRAAVQEYVAGLAAENWALGGPPTAGPSFDAIRRFYRLGVDTEIFAGRDAVARTFLDDLGRIRWARVHRYNLARSGASLAKLATVFTFGLLTQVAIALVHVGNARAIAVTVGLFSIAFATLFGVLAMFDEPFAHAYLVNKAPLLDLVDHLAEMTPR